MCYLNNNTVSYQMVTKIYPNYWKKLESTYKDYELIEHYKRSSSVPYYKLIEVYGEDSNHGNKDLYLSDLQLQYNKLNQCSKYIEQGDAIKAVDNATQITILGMGYFMMIYLCIFNCFSKE